MRTGYSVRKESGKCKAFSAQFDSNGNKVSGDTVVCEEGQLVTVGGSAYTVGTRSANDSTACIFIRKPGSGGNSYSYREVWDEGDGWTP